MATVRNLRFHAEDLTKNADIVLTFRPVKEGGVHDPRKFLAAACGRRLPKKLGSVVWHVRY